MRAYTRVPPLFCAALALVWASGCGEEQPPAGAAAVDAAGDVASDSAADAAGDGGDAGDAADAAADLAHGDVDSYDGIYGFGQPCVPQKRVGRFEVLQDSVYGGSVAGNVADRIDALQLLVSKESEGGCVLWQRKAAVCTPSCSGQQQCVRDQGCQAFPAPLDIGKVELTGLVKPVSMAPKGANKDYFYTDFDADPAAPLADIALKASGGQLAAFALKGKASPPLVVQNTSATLKKGQALSLDWQAAGAPFVVRLSLNVDQHGLTPVTLVCESGDTGQLKVPVALTDALLAYGISGAATATIERRTADSTQLSLPAGDKGCVELVVASRVALQVLAQ